MAHTCPLGSRKVRVFGVDIGTDKLGFAVLEFVVHVVDPRKKPKLAPMPKCTCDPPRPIIGSEITNPKVRVPFISGISHLRVVTCGTEPLIEKKVVEAPTKRRRVECPASPKKAKKKKKPAPNKTALSAGVVRLLRRHSVAFDGALFGVVESQVKDIMIFVEGAVMGALHTRFESAAHADWATRVCVQGSGTKTTNMETPESKAEWAKKRKASALASSGKRKRFLKELARAKTIDLLERDGTIENAELAARLAKMPISHGVFDLCDSFMHAVQAALKRPCDAFSA